MSNHKNPFKFTAKKPPFRKLWSILRDTYTTAIGEQSPETVQLKLFFGLSRTDWTEDKRVLLTEDSLKKFVNSYRLTTLSDLEIKYENFTSIPDNIDSKLFLTFVGNAESSPFEDIFDIAATTSQKDDITRSLRVLSLVSRRGEVIANFRKYVDTIEEESKHCVASKKDMEEIIFCYILEGNISIPEFTYEAEDGGAE